MLRAIVERIFGRSCTSCGTHHWSDLCPRCLKMRFVREARIDRSKPSTKSEGAWPIKPRARLTRRVDEERRTATVRESRSTTEATDAAREAKR